MGRSATLVTLSLDTLDETARIDGVGTLDGAGEAEGVRVSTEGTKGV